MRNKIRDKLLGIDSNVFYGMATADDLKRMSTWDYLIFGQDHIRKKSQTSTDFQGYWYVTIVREEYIPDETVFDIIERLETIGGLRLADQDFAYDYVTKPNTNLVLEILELTFTKTKKGVI